MRLLAPLALLCLVKAQDSSIFKACQMEKATECAIEAVNDARRYKNIIWVRRNITAMKIGKHTSAEAQTQYAYHVPQTTSHANPSSTITSSTVWVRDWQRVMPKYIYTEQTIRDYTKECQNIKIVYGKYRDCLKKYHCFKKSYPSFTSMMRELQSIESNRTSGFTRLSCTGVETSPTGASNENGDKTYQVQTGTANCRTDKSKCNLCLDRSPNVPGHPRFDPSRQHDNKPEIDEVLWGGWMGRWTGSGVERASPQQTTSSYPYGRFGRSPIDVITGEPITVCRMPDNSSPRSCFCGHNSADNKRLIKRFLETSPAAIVTAKWSILALAAAFLFC